MSNLSAIDSEKIADVQREAAPTEEQARAAIVNADMGAVNLHTLVNQKTVGTFLATGVAGHILSRSAMMHADAKRVSAVLMRILEGKIEVSAKDDPVAAALEINAGVEARLGAADAWARLQKALTERDAVDLKAAEIAARGMKNQRPQNLSTQILSKVTYVTSGAQQINNGAPKE